MELTPIRVTIGLRPNGEADHPDFNTLSSVSASGVDWSHYVDQNGSGWLYDKIGHKEVETGSPFGQQFGLLLVPATFASEAVAAFPGTVALLSESEAETFYDDKHASDFDEEILDLDIIQAITEKDRVIPPIPRTAHQNKAMDPLDDASGVRPNWRKTFAQYNAKKGFTIA